jgi:transaldolase
MKLFIDTGSVAEVEEIAAWGVLSGATTNPTLLARSRAIPATSSAESASSWTGRPQPRSCRRTPRAWWRRAGPSPAFTSTSS